MECRDKSRSVLPVGCCRPRNPADQSRYWSRNRLSAQSNGAGQYLLGFASQLKRALYSWTRHASQRAQRASLQCQMGVACETAARSDSVTTSDLGFLAEQQ